MESAERPLCEGDTKAKATLGQCPKSIPPWELVQSTTFLNDFVKHRKLVSLLLLLLLL